MTATTIAAATSTLKSRILSGDSQSAKKDNKVALAVGLSIGLTCAVAIVCVLAYCICKNGLYRTRQDDYDDDDKENYDFQKHETITAPNEPETEYFAKFGKVEQPRWIATPTSAVKKWFNRRSMAAVSASASSGSLPSQHDSPAVILKKFRLIGGSSDSIGSVVKPQVLNLSTKTVCKPLPALPAQAKPQIHRIAKAYQQNLSDELTVTSGDHVRILKDFSDGWYKVELVELKDSTWESTGKKGMIPSICMGQK